MPWPKRSETVILTVNGRNFSDWESVSVKHAMRDKPPYLCRFTCSEGMPIANNFAKLQIEPGDECTVTLAGILAFTGKIMTRQVYYDATRHHIELQAGCYPELNTASVISKTMEYKDQTFGQIADDQLKRFGKKIIFEGGSPPDYKFPRVSAMMGESVSDFLEHVARPLGLTFTSNPQGDFVAVVGGSNGGLDSVTEGKDILIGREVLYLPSAATSQPTIAQGPGNNTKWGAAVSHAPFATIPTGTIFGGEAPGIVALEMASSDQSLLKGRATNERKWMNDGEVTVHATVHGWLRPSGGLWQRNQDVIVNSPMLIMQGDKLRAKSVVFTQDNRSGTRTTLELCNQNAFSEGPAIAPAK